MIERNRLQQALGIRTVARRMLLNFITFPGSLAVIIQLFCAFDSAVVMQTSSKTQRSCINYTLPPHWNVNRLLY